MIKHITLGLDGTIINTRAGQMIFLSIFVCYLKSQIQNQVYNICISEAHSVIINTDYSLCTEPLEVLGVKEDHMKEDPGGKPGIGRTNYTVQINMRVDTAYYDFSQFSWNSLRYLKVTYIQNTRTHTPTHGRTHAHTRTHARTHTHTHTHTQHLTKHT